MAWRGVALCACLRLWSGCPRAGPVYVSQAKGQPASSEKGTRIGGESGRCGVVALGRPQGDGSVVSMLAAGHRGGDMMMIAAEKETTVAHGSRSSQSSRQSSRQADDEPALRRPPASLAPSSVQHHQHQHLASAQSSRAGGQSRKAPGASECVCVCDQPGRWPLSWQHIISPSYASVMACERRATALAAPVAVV